MSERYDHGPLRTYEITWKTGHMEEIQGHQVMFDSHRLNVGGLFGDTITTSAVSPRFTIHGDIDGRWLLLLTAQEEDLLSIRDITDREVTPGTEEVQS